jgi:hypothetical protein
MSRKLPDSMPWQIYQAYLRGPHALFRLFEEAFGRRALSGWSESHQPQRFTNGLSGWNARLQAQSGRCVVNFFQQPFHVICLDFGSRF